MVVVNSYPSESGYELQRTKEAARALSEVEEQVDGSSTVLPPLINAALAAQDKSIFSRSYRIWGRYPRH
jgi:hypothetical protein